MEMVTLKALLEGADPDGQIYVLRDKECFLYVGKTESGIAYRWLNDFCGRLHSYRDGGWFGSDRVANLVIDMMPESLGWVLDCYSRDEAAQLFYPEYRRIMMKCAGLDLDFAIDRLNLLTIEQMAITVLRPCLNVSGNSKGNSLPDKYKYKGKRMREAVEVVQIPE
jgi:hypothetical protein